MIENEASNKVLQMSDSTVYHYCSVETMMAILSNHTLRASNIRKSNDYHEVINCIPMFQKAFRDACKEFSYEDDIFKKCFVDVDSDSYIESLIDNDSLTYYCVCFSEEKDLLSQWRGYADDGRGVAIGFAESFFSRITNDCHMKYKPIEYDKRTTLKRIKEYFISQFEQVRERAIGIPTINDYFKTADEFFSDMVYDAIFFKDDSFQEERERRLVYYPFGSIRNLKYRNKLRDITSYEAYYDRMHDLMETSDKYDELIRKPIGFSWKNGVLSSYADLDFGRYLPGIIPEIILGPQCDIDDHEFKLYLLSCGLDLSITRIRHSQSSYR